MLGANLRAEDLNIYFKTTPRTELLRPFADPVNMALLVTGADGRPVKQGVVDIRLDAPDSGRFFSTDFPLVEGTRLNEMRLPLRQGRANWSSLLPIRGEYRLAVDVITGDGNKATKIFVFNVRENEKKWLFLGGFSLSLFFLGFAAGRIFTLNKPAVSLWVGLILSLGTAPSVDGQTGMAGELAAVLEVAPASVGSPSLVRWNMKRSHEEGPTVAALTLAISHLEKGKVVFSVERLPVVGEFAMKFHFTDGTDYRINSIAEVPGRRPIVNEQFISVPGVEPPLKAMVPALSYFLLIMALGLAAGRWTKRRSA
jgi:hypothetical protein